VEYLANPPGGATLLKILAKLDAPPADLVRTGEKRFKELGLDKGGLESAQAVAELLAREPSLMQRPVLVKGNRAVIGRPEEKIAQLLDA
jgi:arsenate reductase